MVEAEQAEFGSPSRLMSAQTPRFFSAKSPSPDQQPTRQQQPSPQQEHSQSQQTSSHKALEKPRLRLSCDSCAGAKVRCGKQRPRCERCLVNDLKCVYGRSLKHGRGKSRPQAEEPAAMSPCQQKSPNWSTARENQGDLQRSLFDMQRYLSELVQKLGATNNPLPAWPRLTNSNLSTVDVPVHRADLPITPDKLRDDLFDTEDMDVHSAVTKSPEALGLSQFAVTDDMLNMGPDPDFSSSIGYEPVDDGSLSFDAMCCAAEHGIFPPLEPTTSSDSSELHDCNAIALSTQAMLHSTLWPSTLAVQNFDHFLCCNREAKSNIYQLLKCSCARHPQMAMPLAFVIMRIIFCHQLVASTRTPSSVLPPPTPEGLSLNQPFAPPPMKTSGAASCLSQGAFLASGSVKIGDYVPDEEDQDAMRHILLLRELKKLGPLIEAFAQAGRLADPGPGQLRSVLASCLRSELSRAIAEVCQAAKSAMGHA